MITIKMEDSFEVLCNVCSKKLNAELSNGFIYVDQCESCRNEAEKDGYSNGYADAQDERD